MKKTLFILVLLFSSSVVAEETNQLLEIKVNELSVYKTLLKLILGFRNPDFLFLRRGDGVTKYGK